MNVAVGVLSNAQGEVLIALRQKGQHLEGLWEFPGGKVEAHETTAGALQREFEEELGVKVKPQQPLITIAHQYPEKTVLLDVWRVALASGQAFGKEGQEIKWLPKAQLNDYAFPEANQSIIKALLLPTEYLITPECGADPALFIQQVHSALQRGIKLLQLRSKQLPAQDFHALAYKISALCKENGAHLLINSDCAAGVSIPGVGLHLSAAALNSLPVRPVDPDVWCGASCHNVEEVKQALALGVDFICFSPVLKTASHPQANPLGWVEFAKLCQHCTVPVFALGGLNPSHHNQVVALGGHGVAAIRGYWPS